MKSVQLASYAATTSVSRRSCGSSVVTVSAAAVVSADSPLPPPPSSPPQPATTNARTARAANVSGAPGFPTPRFLPHAPAPQRPPPAADGLRAGGILDPRQPPPAHARTHPAGA